MHTVLGRPTSTAQRTCARPELKATDRRQEHIAAASGPTREREPRRGAAGQSSAEAHQAVRDEWHCRCDQVDRKEGHQATRHGRCHWAHRPARRRGVRRHGVGLASGTREVRQLQAPRCRGGSASEAASRQHMSLPAPLFPTHRGGDRRQCDSERGHLRCRQAPAQRTGGPNCVGRAKTMSRTASSTPHDLEGTCAAHTNGCARS